MPAVCLRLSVCRQNNLGRAQCSLCAQPVFFGGAALITSGFPIRVSQPGNLFKCGGRDGRICLRWGGRFHGWRCGNRNFGRFSRNTLMLACDSAFTARRYSPGGNDGLRTRITFACHVWYLSLRNQLDYSILSDFRRRAEQKFLSVRLRFGHSCRFGQSYPG